MLLLKRKAQRPWKIHSNLKISFISTNKNKNSIQLSFIDTFSWRIYIPIEKKINFYWTLFLNNSFVLFAITLHSKTMSKVPFTVMLQNFLWTEMIICHIFAFTLYEYFQVWIVLYQYILFNYTWTLFSSTDITILHPFFS